MLQLVEAIAAPSARTSSRARAIAGTIGLVLLLGACFWVHGLLLRANVANRDFVAYWTTGRLLALHQNPYDRAAIFQIEKSVHADIDVPFIMRNPPWALFLTVPLGWFDAPTAGLLWLIAVIVAGLGSLQLIRPSQLKPIPLILIFFAPVLICVEAEQMSLFVLFGLALFASLERRRPFWAGFGLSLTMLKPHLLVLVLLIGALEVLRRRQIRIFTGFLAGFAAMNLVALGLAHDIWRLYLSSIAAEQVQDQFLPNLSNAYRLIVPTHLWPVFIPLAAAIVWAIWYWRQQQSAWNWSVKLPLFAAVSVLVAPYSWPYDCVLFWPLLLAAWPRASRYARAVLVVLNLCAIAVTLCAHNVASPLYLWTGPAWMLWCVYVGWREKSMASKDETCEVTAIAA